MDTVRQPPFGYRVPASRHWFVQAQRNGGSEIKAAVSNGRVKWLLYDGFFSFAVIRQLSFHISDSINRVSAISLLCLESRLLKRPKCVIRKQLGYFYGSISIEIIIIVPPVIAANQYELF